MGHDSFNARLQIEEYQVGQDHMCFFNLLHVVGGHNDGAVEQGLHLSPAASGEADGGGPNAAGEFEPTQYVGRVSAAADAERDVARLDKIFHLPGKDVGVAGVVGPGRQHGDVIDQRNCLQAFHAGQRRVPGNVRGFAQVRGHVRCQRSAPAISERENRVVSLIGTKEEVHRAARLIKRESVEYGFQNSEVLRIVECRQIFSIPH